MKKRIIATILSIALMMTSVPWTALDVSAASQEQVTESLKASAGDTYVSDDDTFDSWKNEFSATNTEYAGAVWTDKSVFEAGYLTDDNTTDDDDKHFDELNVSKFVSVDSNGNITMGTETDPVDVTVADNNFLVAMSALGSTKEITGYSALPSDTVFVLDVSNSMSNDDLAKMVEATNKAIEKLQNLNRHNRVAVVVYGTDSAVLMGIDRYSTTKTATDSDGKTYPVYIEMNSDYSQMRTARSRKTSTGGSSVNINSINFTSIVNGMPKWDYSTMDDYDYDYDKYLDALATYLERSDILGTQALGGIDINWRNAVENKRNNQSWEEFLRNRVQQAINNQQNQQQYQETSDLTNSAGTLVTASVTASGATYIQGGMDAAHDLFKGIYDAGDTTIETGLIQGGTARIPITVLMSDGAPTYGSTTYANAENNAARDNDATPENEYSAGRNLGGGGAQSINDYLVFPAQLTAAYLSKQMEEYYGRDALIYTLGLGLEYDEARRVLDPSNYSSSSLNTWWTNYQNTGKNGTISGYSYNNNTITRLEGGIDSETEEDLSLIPHRYYVDKYFGADSAADLVGAFDNIVEAIILQSKYYPTLVENGKYDLDGYITFEDEIGGYVEVKNVKGMLLGDTLYTGKAFVDAINTEGLFGNASTYTEYGHELLESISERLGIDDATARTLLATAWRSGVRDENGDVVDGQAQMVGHNNYIGWYGDATNKYLGHWDDFTHTAENYPDGAVYLNKCYLFQGDLSETYSSLAGADMMHIIVQVHEEIATGHQCVIWKIPASLVPLVTYKVSVEGNQLVDGMAATLTSNISEVSPISLLYEVGMVDTINPVNLTAEIADTGHVRDEHKVLDDQGNTIGYAFYSNRWGEQHENDGSGATDIFDPIYDANGNQLYDSDNKPRGNMATVSHFVPSKENERYYYTEDTIICTDKSGTAYTGSVKPDAAGTYYHPYAVVGKHNDSEEIKVHTHYLPVSDAALALAEQLDDGTGRWYIPAGIIHQAIEDYTTYKDGAGAQSEVGGLTGTMPYVDKPYIKNLTDIYDFLGNNGRWIMYSATGLAVTKTIDDVNIAAGSQTFEFVVTLANKTTVPSGMKVVDINGSAIGHTTGVEGNNLNIYFSITNGQTAYITGLAAGTEYTVKEKHHDNYVVKSAASSETADGYGVIGTGKNTTVKGVVDQYVLDTAEFINTATSHKGSLVVSKTITHPYGDTYVIPVNGNTVFTVNVVLEGLSWAADETTKTFDASGTVKYKDDGNYVTGIVKTVTYSKDAGKVTSVTLDNNTVLSDGNWWVAHDDSFTILGIPEDVKYTVSETEVDDDGFTLDATNSKGLSGTIISDDTVYAELVNDYEPADTTSAGLSAVITKVLSGREWKADDSFSFFLQKYTESGWQDVKVNDTPVTLTITGGTDGGSSRSATNSAAITFTEKNIGTNYFRIGERKGTAEGITYDETYRYYSVKVSDDDMNGHIDVTVENYQGVKVTETDENSYKLEVTFTNHHAQAVTNISLHKTLTNNTGLDVTMDEFIFEFCEEDGCTKGDECPDKDAHLTLKANANGDLTFPLVYVENDLSNVKDWTLVTGEGESATTESFTSDDAEGKITVDKEGEPILDQDGKNVAVPEKATKSKTFTYYLWEKDNGKNGMVYDNTVYKVEVVVTVKKGAAKNDVAVTSTAVTAIRGNSAADNNVAQFRNTYTVDPVPTKTTIQGTKNLEGRNILANEFEFELYSAHSTFETIALLETQTTKVGGSASETFEFKLPTEADGKYSKAGTYYYVIKEKAGTNAAITYDNSVYHITVVVGVKADGDDQNNADELYVESIVINKVGGESGSDVAVEFNNKYTVLQGASITVNGDKDVTGKTVLNAGEFTFGVYNNANCTEDDKVYVDANGYVVENAADGTHLVAKSAAVSGAFHFTINYAQKGTYTYYIKEEAADNLAYGGTMTTDSTVYKVVATVADDGHVEGTVAGDGKLEASYVLTKADGSAAESIKFTNTFVPTPVKSKSVLGVKIYADDDNNAIGVNTWKDTFKFAMYQSDKDFQTEGAMVLTQNVPNGKIYTGTYNEATGKFDQSVSLRDYADTTADNINDKQQFAFDLTFTKAGTYHYIIKEVAGTEANVHYDTAEYYVTYIVTEAADGTGALSVTSSVVYGGNTVNSAEFRNFKIRQYDDVRVHLTKEIANTSTVTIPMSLFQFGLYTDEGCSQPVMKDNAPLVSYASTNGDASFYFQYDNVSYAISDNHPYTVTYYAKENIPADEDKIAGITYDESVYRVDIEVKVDKLDDDGDGNRTELLGEAKLTKIVDSEGNYIANANQTAEADGEATFTNKFEIDDAKLVIGGTKVLDGRDLTANDKFEFGLYHAVLAADETTGWSAGELVGTNYLVNNNGADFSFPELTYSAEGIHYYVVKETTPADSDKLINVTYDTTEYLVKVVVTNGGEGEFVATETVVGKLADGRYTVATGENPLSATFTNVFAPEPIDVAIEGTKVLGGDQGATLKAGEFTFELYNANEHYNEVGSAIATATNDANGEFEFTSTGATDDVNDAFTSELIFTEAGTYRFIVVEKAGTDPTIDYDDKEYNIEIVVTKSADGVLDKTVTVLNRAEGETGLVVTNIYDKKDAHTSVTISKVLTNNTGVEINETVQSFEFGLYDSTGALVDKVKPTANGTNVFNFNYTDDDFTATKVVEGVTVPDYDGETVYNYTIKEIIPTPKTAGMIYDESVYEVKVVLRYEGKNLTATPTITKVGDTGSKTTAAFENVYDLGSVKVSIPVTKSFTGRNWTANDVFTVNLYRTTDIQNPAMGTLIDTVDIRQAAGSYAVPTVNHTFTNDTVDVENALRFTSVGTYYFAVKEMYPQGANAANNYIVDGVAYDATEYGVVVTVEKEGAGLKATVKPHVLGHNEQTNIQFNNVYAVRDENKPHVIFKGTKELTGRDIVDEEFNFELYKATVDNGVWTTEADYYKTSKNEGNTFQFVEEEYSANGTYHYVIKEVPLGHPTITYDKHEYRVTVVISDDGAGNWKTPDVSIVKVDENGNVVASGLTMDNVVFNNTYKPFKTPAVITVNKEITEITTGVDLSTKEFKFGLYTDENCSNKLYVDETGYIVAQTAEGARHATITAKELVDGSITLHYTDKNVKATPYIYYLKEIEHEQAEVIPGMDYSGEVYKVEVTVEFQKNNSGEDVLVAIPKVSAISNGAVAPDGTAVITNKYQLSPATLDISGQKVLPQHEIRKDDFTFVMYEAVVDPANGNVPATEIWQVYRPIDTALNDSQSGDVTNDFDEFVFDTLTFEHAGVYHYIIEESVGALRGVTYDADRYQVTVEVAPVEGEAKLVAEITNVDRVNYTYNQQGERIIDTSEDTTDGIADGKVEVALIPNEYAVTFTNSYNATGSFSIGGTKEIDKRDWRDGDSFTFELYTATVDAQDRWTVGGKVAERTVTDENAVKEFIFSNIEVSGVEAEIENNTKVAKIGTHYFVIKEVDNGDTDTTAIDYDGAEYRITVNTKDNGEGVLTTGKWDGTAFTEGEFAVTKVEGTTETELGAADTITFVNKYQTKPVTATISGKKVLDGADIKDFENQFTFELYATDSSWTLGRNAIPVATTTNNLKDGEAFEFAGTALTFDREGKYYFIVKEAKGDNPIVKYDEDDRGNITEHKVVITVTDTGVTGGEAQLAAAVDVLSFTDDVVVIKNSYNPASVTFNIKKAITFTNGAAHTLGGFKFKVEGVGNSTLFEAVSGNDGTIAVPIEYTEHDLGANNAPVTYTYEITEINTKIKRMTYDDRVYTIEVEVYAENGELKTAITQNGTSVEEVTVQFNNKYQGDEDVPDSPKDPGKVVNTGDMNNNILYAGIMVVSAACLFAVLFIIRKRKEDEEEAEA